MKLPAISPQVNYRKFSCRCGKSVAKEEVYGEVNHEKLCKECCRTILMDVIASVNGMARKLFGHGLI